MKPSFSIFIFILGLATTLSSQNKMFVSRDSIPVYNTIENHSVIGYLHYGDNVVLLKKTKSPCIELNENAYRREDMFSTFYQIATSSMKGYVASSNLKPALYAPPAKILGVTEGDLQQDEIYPIGWTKNSFAYMIEGYIDGAVDGLTVRYRLKDFNNHCLDSLNDYTSYTEPIKCMWKQKAFEIQNSLWRNKIQSIDTNLIPMKMPYVVGMDTLHLYWGMTNGTYPIQASFKGVERNVYMVDFEPKRIWLLRYLINPLDNNKIIIVVAFITESTSHYVDVIPIDLSKFKKKK